MVDLLVSSEQQQIIDSVSDFLGTELPVSRLRPAGLAARSDSASWTRMGSLGWFTLALPEAMGGSGLTAIEEALLFRQLGKFLVSPNVLASSISARLAAANNASDLLDAIGSGTERVALAHALESVSVGATITGRFQLLDLRDARWLLVIDEVGQAAIVDLRDVNDIVQVASAVDGISIDRATISATPVFRSAPGFDGHVLLRLLAGSMLSGICEATRDLATEYAKIRVQFGQPIGSFQAIKHKCADMALRADAAAALVNFASIRVAGQKDDAVFQATSAKLLCARYALLNAKETIQVHGGIGFTVECDAHHYLKRAHMLDQIGGSVRRQQQLLLQEPPPAQEDAA
jgi:alkylation response protein AidB-like acyl-CoA dehydrogenase